MPPITIRQSVLPPSASPLSSSQGCWVFCCGPSSNRLLSIVALGRSSANMARKKGHRKKQPQRRPLVQQSVAAVRSHVSTAIWQSLHGDILENLFKILDVRTRSAQPGTVLHCFMPRIRRACMQAALATIRRACHAARLCLKLCCRT